MRRLDRSALVWLILVGVLLVLVVNPLVRLLWVFAVLLTFPLAIVAYLITWIVIPEEPEYSTKY